MSRCDAALARVRDLERALRDIISIDLGPLPMDDSPAVRIARAALENPTQSGTSGNDPESPGRSAAEGNRG